MRDRFIGCIIGQAVGDALGFPVEGYPPEQAAAAVTPFPTHFPHHPSGLFPPGQYTDDTQMMRAILESLVEVGRPDPADIASRFASLWRDGEIVGRGRSTTEAINRLMAGVPWDRAGTPPPSAGNGSAMRTCPLGLFFHDDPSAMARAAADVSRITHADARCLAGAVAVSAAVAYAATHTTIDLSSMTRHISDLASTYNEQLAALIDRLPHWLAMDEPSAVTEIRRAGLPAGSEPDWPGISPFVVPTVLASLYAFMRTPDEFGAAVGFVIALGGDVDTTAAITGAISGAFNDIAGIPAGLAKSVNDRGRHGYPVLTQLGKDLWLRTKQRLAA